MKKPKTNPSRSSRAILARKRFVEKLTFAEVMQRGLAVAADYRRAIDAMASTHAALIAHNELIGDYSTKPAGVRMEHVGSFTLATLPIVEVSDAFADAKGGRLEVVINAGMVATAKTALRADLTRAGIAA